MAEDKVQFNLKNVHYAVIEDENTPTWGAPVHVPGAVSVALEQVGEMSKFHADGIVYYQSNTNGGYEGDLEMAIYPDQMLQDVWGMTKKAIDNIMVENANDKTKAFALLFEIDGDNSGRKYCLYNCIAGRPNIESKTNEDTKEPVPQKIKISAAPLPNGDIKAHTCSDSASEVLQNWFAAVYHKGVA